MTAFELADREFWVLHAPYPDKSWRGLEKCSAIVLGPGWQPKTYPCATTGHDYEVPLLFDHEADARAYANKHALVGMVPVRVLLVTPFVRQPLDAVPEHVVS